VNHGVGDGHGVLSSRDIHLRASVRGVTKTGILPWPLDREADSVAPVRRLRVVS
jgi:hypothetical protein